MDFRDVVHRLRVGNSVKAIQRETGRHKTVIRVARDTAEREEWLSLATELPSEGEIGRFYEETLGASREVPHPLELYEGQIKEWAKAKHSVQVTHQLLNTQGVGASESTVRRWIHRRYPHLPSPAILRATIAGEVMEVDFGYLDAYWDAQNEKQRKVWFLSGRLRHSRIGLPPDRLRASRQGTTAAMNGLSSAPFTSSGCTFTAAACLPRHASGWCGCRWSPPKR